MATAKKIEAHRPNENATEVAQGVRETGDLVSSVWGVAGAMKNGPILTISIESEAPGAIVGGFKLGTGASATGAHVPTNTVGTYAPRGGLRPSLTRALDIQYRHM